MKKLLFLFAIALCCSSCKDGADLFKGSYSYKTSGSVEMNIGESTAIETSLQDSYGSITIERIYKDRKDSVLLIKNEVGGSVQVIRAYVEGDSISLVPYSRSFSIMSGTTIYRATATVAGYGHIYGDYSLVINESYLGVISSDSQIIGAISSENIVTVGKRND